MSKFFMKKVVSKKFTKSHEKMLKIGFSLRCVEDMKLIQESES